MADGSNKYKLAKKIARGGMAEIFIASKTASEEVEPSETLCCVKRILPHYANDSEFIQMFRDEARICQKFNHPNLIRVFDFTEIDGAWAIVMDLVAGSDLRAIFSACEKQKRRLSIPMICYIVAEAAKGLHHAHNKIDEITGKSLGIVHRDISPQNILVSFEGQVKVTDFGIAEADSKLNETKPGIVKGKYSYMSPEQIMAKPVDHRTDVFALGIVLWEALSLKRLFQGANEVETIQLVKNCKITKNLQTLNENVDDELLQIVEQALKKDLKERFQSCAELEMALRTYIASVDPSFSHIFLSDFLKETLKKKHDEFQMNIEEALEKEQNLDESTTIDSKPLQVKDNSDAPKENEPDTNSHLPDIMHSAHEVFGQKAEKSTQNKPFGEGLNLSNVSKSQLAQQQSIEKGGKKTNVPSWAMHEPTADEASFNLFPKALILQILGILAVMSVTGGGYYFYLNSRPTSQTLRLEFTPSRTLVKINGKMHSENYVKSPLVLPELPLGEYDLSFTRSGFENLDYKVTLKGNKSVKRAVLSLKRSQPIAPVEFRLHTDTDQKSVEFRFKQNLDSGLITKKKPYKVMDLLYGRSYKVNFKSRDFSFPCKFQPRARSWNQPYVVYIFPESKNCKFKAPKNKNY